jgi:triosephosphate isomerase
MVQSRKPWVGGNWKCNGTLSANAALIDSLKASLSQYTEAVDVVVAPAALHVGRSLDQLSGTGVHVATQNISKTKNGAFTGEMSAEMVKDFGVEWTLIGHSERRHKFGETDADIAEKVKLAEASGLKVVLCIGELLEERKAGQTDEVCRRQMMAVIPVVNNWDNIVIAYEPVWAIGTGVVATPVEAQDAHLAVRGLLAETVSAEVAAKTRIVYGGSVTPENSAELYDKEDVDGFLVGGASLKPSFAEIVKSTSRNL